MTVYLVRRLLTLIPVLAERALATEHHPEPAAQAELLFRLAVAGLGPAGARA